MKLIALALLLASPLAAQANPICTQSRTSALVTKGVTFTTADSGSSRSWYVSRDSVSETCAKLARTGPKGPPVIVPPPVDTVNPPVDTATPPVPPTGRDPMYFNSAEPACSATALLCDDFEDGDWYSIDGDKAPSLLLQDGWYGTIYANPITPAKAAVCGNQGFRSNCAATHGQLNGSQGGRNMAEHLLASRADKIFVRFYTKALAGYRFGAEKMLSLNLGGGGITHGNLHIECGSGGGKTTAKLQWQPVDGSSCRDILPITADRWYYVELAITASTGTLEVWADDCGGAGTTCPATPTKRLTVTGLRFFKVINNGTQRIETREPVAAVWFENWANPGSSGTRLLDNVVVDTKRIGF